MASYLRSVGLVADLLRTAAVQGEEQFPVAGGRYVRWRAGGGAELWVALNDAGLIETAQAHFDGPSRMRVRLTNTWPTLRFEGRCQARTLPDGPPFAFDPPDYLLLAQRFPCPMEILLQLAVFARGLDVFKDEDAFAAAQSKDETKLAANSFVAVGPSADRTGCRRAVPTPGINRLTFPAGLYGDWNRPAAAFAGRVLRAERITNPATGLPFHHLEVDTLIGRVDVVADPAIVRAPPVAGAVVGVEGWLSGRVVDVT